MARNPERVRAFEDLGDRIVGRRLDDREAKTKRGRKKTLALAFSSPDRETEQLILMSLRGALAQHAGGDGPVATAFREMIEQVPRR